MTSGRTDRTDPDERADALGGETPVKRGSFRDRMRSKPGIGHLWRVGVFMVGLLFIALGGALVVLPGPLTIPPIVIGLWIWSTEFHWAHRMFASGKEKAKEAWAHAKQHPVSSTVLTIGGLTAAALIIWSVTHFNLIAQGKQLIGLS